MESKPTTPFRSAARFLGMAASLLFATALPAAAQQPGTSPVKIYLLMGESNMEGHGEISPVGTPGTLQYIVANDPGSIYQFLVIPGATDIPTGTTSWVARTDVWMHYERLNTTAPRIGNLMPGYGANGGNVTIGPELGFGHKVGATLGNQVLIVKASWGGTTLGNDFLPPSSEAYPEPRIPGDKGYYYKQTLRLVEDAISKLGTYFPNYDGQGYEIAGICWHQGWNDRGNSSFSTAYQTNLANLIRDLRSKEKGLGIPGLPFVIATTGMDGGTTYGQVELAQLAMTAPANATTYADFVGTVGVIDTRGETYNGFNYWQPYPSAAPSNQNYHWNRSARTYLHVGLAMGDKMPTLTSPRSPSRLRATGGPAGITLTWQNGTEMPTSVQVLRDGWQIAAAAPVSPATFLDSTALPGVHNYQLVFTMPVTPSTPLTVTHNSAISGLTAHRITGGVTLKWTNNLGYAGIQIQRNGVTIQAALSGSATSYVDTTAPTTGLLTYTVVPTTGSATPAQVQIFLGPHTSPGAVIYEPFDFNSASSLTGVTPSGVGLAGPWTRVAGSSSNEMQVSHSGLSLGTLPVAGNRLRNSASGGSRANRALIGSSLTNAGLLADGATLWLSVLVQPVVAANSTSGIGLSTGDATTYNSAVNAVGIVVQNGSDLAYWSDLAGTDTRITVKSDMALNTTHLVVAKITWGTGGANDTMEIFMPGSNLTQGSRFGAIQSFNLNQSTFDRIVLYNSGGGIEFDEIRFGANFEAVTGRGPVDHFAISAISSPQTAGAPITGVTLTAQDAANQTVTGFTGTVTFGGTAGFYGTSANFVAGVLSGVSVTPTLTGNNLTLTVNDGAGHSGSTTIATVRSRFNAWAAGPFAGALTNPSGSLDFDNGGLPTGIEWVVGGDPTNGSDDIGKTPTFDSTTDPDYFIYTYRRSDVAHADAQTTIAAQYGSDLSGWTAAVHDGTNIIITPANDGAGPGVDSVQVKIKRTLAVGSKIFIRLKTTISP